MCDADERKRRQKQNMAPLNGQAVANANRGDAPVTPYARMGFNAPPSLNFKHHA